MRIYHYTNIETLALILKNRTIRFSRLDTVDDPDEYSLEVSGKNPAYYTYVSCWTKNEKESIPQWLIYGNHRHGVRISIDENMFDMHDIALHKSWLPEDKLQDKDFILQDVYEEQVPHKIQYVDDPQSYYRQNILVDFNEVPAFNLKAVGLYKSKDWEFQNEYRFKIHLFPKDLEGSIYAQIAIFVNNAIPKNKFIDIPIKPSVYDSIEITLGPGTTSAERIKVEALSKEYLGSIKVTESIFKGNIKI